ncbi:MAG: thioredoxin, partial [Flavobacterium sp.]
KGKDRTDLSIPTHIYLNTQSDTQLVSETNWRIIANGVTDIKSREFQYVLDHQKDFAAVASQNRVDRKVENIVIELLRPDVDNLDTINYYKHREIAKSIKLQKTDSLVFKFDLTLAERTEKWQYYKKVTLEETQKFVWNDASFLKDIGQTYLKHITDEESLKKSISWVKHSLELNDSYDGNLLLARLYNKIKDKKSAIKYAKDAKVICTEMTWSTKDVDALLTELNTK